MVVQAALSEHVEHAAAAPAFGSTRRSDARHARQHDRTGAHRAGLQRHIEGRVQDAPGPARATLRAARGPRRGPWGRRSSRSLRPVRSARPRGPRPRRSDVIVLQRTLGLAQGQAHEHSSGGKKRSLIGIAGRRDSALAAITKDRRDNHVLFARPSTTQTAECRGLYWPYRWPSSAWRCRARPPPETRGGRRGSWSATPQAGARTRGAALPLPRYPEAASAGRGGTPRGEPRRRAKRIRARPGVSWAVPDYVAHASGKSSPTTSRRNAEPEAGRNWSGTSSANGA